MRKLVFAVMLVLVPVLSSGASTPKVTAATDLIAKSPWVQSRAFGSFSAAKTYAALAGKPKHIVVDRMVEPITGPCTVPKGVHVHVLNGCKLTRANANARLTFKAGSSFDTNITNQAFDIAFLRGEILFESGTVKALYPQWWGGPSINDGVTDAWPAIQAAVDTATIAGSGVSNVNMTEGNYSTSQPIAIHQWSGAQYSFTNIELKGPAYSSATMKVAKIIPTFNNLPAIWMQRTRSCVIDRLYIQGKNTFSMSLANMITSDTWTTGGARDSINSPYAAICVDPFGTSLPGGAGDGGYPGMSSWYRGGSGGSSRVKITNSYINGFVVGIMLTPNQQTQNCENVLIEDCWIDNVKSCIAVGQSQSRSVYVNRITCWGPAKYIIDCTSYGNGNAAAPYVDGANIAGAVKFFCTVNTSWTPSYFRGIHAEGLYSFGFLGWSGEGFPVTIEDSYLHFVEPDPYPTKDVGFQFYTVSPVIFKSCYLGRYNNKAEYLNFIPGNANVNYTFENCTLDSFPGIATLSDNAGFNQFTMRNCSSKYSSNWRGISTGKVINPTFWNNIDRTALSPYSQYIIDANDTAYMTGGHQLLSIGTFAISINESTKKATFTIDDPGKVQVGDHLYTNSATTTFIEQPGGGMSSTKVHGIVGTVDTIVGTTVTLRAITQTLTDGTSYAFQIYHHPKIHRYAWGDVTSGSNVITNCTTTDGYVVGDRISGTGIPVAAYVTAKDATTITISMNATATNTAVKLFDAPFYIKGRRTAAPSGMYARGDHWDNSEPAVGSPRGWTCTVGGTSATIVSDGNL